MKNKLTYLIMAMIAMSTFSSYVMSEESYLVTSSDWSRPRTAEHVRSLPSVQAVVDKWLNNQNRQIEIRYPGGEEGVLWAGELKDWIVALGIPGDAILLQPGYGEADKLSLELIQPY